MTKDRDFKRLVRERQARTGESYTTARRNLRSAQSPSGVDGHGLALAGGNMSAEEAERLESHVADHPGDAQGRARLLGYYFRNRPTEPSVRTQHVMWFIANDPRSGVAGTPFCEMDKHDDPAWGDAAGLWLAHIEQSPDDPALLSNARNWFTRHDRELAIALAERVVELTGAADARLRLAAILRLSMPSHPEKPEEAKAAGRRILDALGERPENRDSLASWLQSAAWAALTAGEPDRARDLADELVGLADDDAWYAGNATHHAHLIRGHLALAGGDIDTAEAELAAAAATRGSPQLNSFGPNLSLAAALLQHGRADSVIAFLRECRRFWAPPTAATRSSPLTARVDELVDEWVRVIENGGTPNFGANLHYGN